MPRFDVETYVTVHERIADFYDRHPEGRVVFTRRVTDLLRETNSQHYIKEDLQPHLPAGYENVKHRVQNTAGAAQGRAVVSRGESLYEVKEA